MYDSKASSVKIKVRIANAANETFADGSPQPLYFAEGPEQVGMFKGMTIILQQQEFDDMSRVCAQCKDSKCAPGASNCCCHQILYNQPDFQGVESLPGD